VAFLADDGASAETALADASIGYTRRAALTIRMENQPGAGAATFRISKARGCADTLVPDVCRRVVQAGLALGWPVRAARAAAACSASGVACRSV
jgi:hypothetical protein